ncbi:DUF1289 domain-containing protein [Hydrocarboniphaga daqingensis]|uniref:DUF1289 domain-containing protein n=1 Tax=Hydrocarboniphaga daqingensis TaxID=490188 RepID=UPI00093295BC|nr:DUF1289 domain-containing protein [Hydrocarboniphaga daqingensis]
MHFPSLAPEPAPASPCIGVCLLNEAEICTGCGRSIGEIVEWSAAAPQRQQQICAAAAQRLSIIESIPAPGVVSR